MMGYGYGMGFGGFGWIGMIIFLALVVVGVILLVRAMSNQSPGGSHAQHDRALGVARERYARGELTKEQFEVIRHDLGA